MNTIFQISERVQTNEALPSKYKIFEKRVFNRKTKIKKKKKILWKFHFLKIPDAPTTNNRICRVHNIPHPTTPTPTEANMVYPDIFLQKWVCSIVLQKSAVEISEVRSAILKKCAVYIFRSAR